MKKLFLISALIFSVIFLFGCQGSDGKSKNLYHDDDVINTLISNYNEVADIKNAENEVSQDFSYQTFINVNGVNLRISNSSTGLFFTYTDENITNDNLVNVFKTMMSCADSGISTDDVATILDSLKNGEHTVSTKYNYKDWGFTYDESELSDGSTKYMLKAELLNSD